MIEWARLAAEVLGWLIFGAWVLYVILSVIGSRMRAKRARWPGVEPAPDPPLTETPRE